MNTAKYEVTIGPVEASRKRAVRALRVIGRMSLARALGVYELVAANGEVVVVAGVDDGVAEHIRAELERGGIRAAVAPSNVDRPMVLDPSANLVYRWGPLQTLHRTSNG